MVAQLDRDFLKIARTRSVARLASYGLFEGRPATTRGQWVNPIVKAHLLAAKRFLQFPGPERPIFILGVGRSGTTLLGRLLAAHPDVGFLNEPKAMWHLIDPVEDVSGFYNTSATALMRRSASDVTPKMRSDANRLYGYYLWLTRSARVVDKYCELTYRRDYLRALFPDSVLIAIVRRPDDVAHSISRWSAEHGSASAGWWGVNGRKWEILRRTMLDDQPDAESLMTFAETARDDADRGIVEWIVGMRELCTARPGGGLNHLVRYEDLTADPQAEIVRVLSAADLAPSPAVDCLAKAAVRSTRSERQSSIPDALRPAVERLLVELGYSG